VCMGTPVHYEQIVRDRMGRPWMTGALEVRHVTIYSKCGNEVKGAPEGATVIILPNVGRVDHAYAYHLANLPLDTDPDEVWLGVSGRTTSKQSL
jgi:hypothetical protein